MSTITPRIAILGWGSLIWDTQPQFNAWHKAWQDDGPTLPLEFSRISRTRSDALTLVIDRENGQDCKVAFAVSKRRRPRNAIEDLRRREKTTLEHIGFYCASGRCKCELTVPGTIPAWATTMGFDVVIWTGLGSNFVGFSVDVAIEHLDGLSPKGKDRASEYLRKAPEFVNTPLRSALVESGWLDIDKNC